MTVFINILLNILFVSIPEELIWFMTICAFLKRFEMIEKYAIKENIKWYFLSSVPISILINICKYTIIPKPIIFLLMVMLMYFITTYIIKKTSFEDDKISKLQIILANIISIIFILIPEEIGIMFVVNKLNIPIDMATKSFIYAFVFSSITRAVQIIALKILIAKKIDILKYIYDDKKIIMMLSTFLSAFTTFWFSVSWIFCNYIIFNNISCFFKMSIFIVMFLAPSFIYVIITYIVLHLTKKLMLKDVCHSNMLDDIDY